MPMYDTDEEIQHRLRDTYALYDGQVCYIVGSARPNGKLGVQVSKLPFLLRENIRSITLDDPLFVYTEFPLGYLNTAQGAVYLRRIARRHRQQGINAQNVQASPDINHDVNFNWNRDVLQTDSLNKLVQNDYPKLSEALTLSLNSRLKTFAIHRKFSVGVDSLESENLYYKAEIVARRQRREKFVIPRQYRYLIETLREINVPVE